MERLLVKPLKRPWLVVAIVLVITVFFFYKMRTNSRMETNLDKYMPQNHPAFVYSNKAEKWFDIKDGIIIAIENDNGVFNPTTLTKVKKLTKELQRMKEINKNDVTSLYTADNIVSTEDGLDVRRFYKRVPKDSAALAALRQKVITNDMVFGKLVSKDEKVAIVVARIKSDVFTQKFYHQLLKLAHKYEGPEKIYVAGRPIVEGTLAYLGPRDMRRMVPIVIVVIIAVLFLLLRSWKSTLMTITVVLLSSIWTFGLMATLNIPIYSVSTMIPVMLIAIGIAYGVHLYSHLFHYMEEHPGLSKLDATKNMLQEMWKPVMMAAVTTMVGFISLLTSQVYPVKYFGIFSAFGVGVAFILSVLLIPAGNMILGLPRSKKGLEEEDAETAVKKNRFAYRFADYLISHRKLVYILTLIVVGLSVYGTSKVWINSSFLDKFEKNSEIRKTDRFINEHFGGTSTLNVILEGKKPDTFKEPQVLKTVAQMQSEVVNTLPVVGDAFSLVDFIKRMNKVMHADSEKYNTIPDNQDLIAQYLLLYEMSGDPAKLWQVVTEDYKKLNVTFQLKSDNSKALKSAIAIIEKYRPEFEKMGITLNYAGSGYKALVFTDLILKGQISSLLLSLVIVVVLLSIMFKSLKIGLIGSIPITITTIISFGIMGLLGIPLSSTTALISSIAIGIGIDYAVHFIDRYRVNARIIGSKFLAARQTIAEEIKSVRNPRTEEDIAEAKVLTSHLTMHHSGKAILYNAIVVIAGFMVLLFSVFPPNRALGLLVSLNMFTSFVGTLTIMFIILYVSNTYFDKKNFS